MIFAIARNICIDFIRNRRQLNSNLNDEIISWQETKVHSDEKLESIWNVINSLADEYRQVIYLRFSADLDYKEIAESLKIPIGTVRSRLHRGLKAVKDKLQEQ